MDFAGSSLSSLTSFSTVHVFYLYFISWFFLLLVDMSVDSILDQLGDLSFTVEEHGVVFTRLVTLTATLEDPASLLVGSSSSVQLEGLGKRAVNVDSSLADGTACSSVDVVSGDNLSNTAMVDELMDTGSIRADQGLCH
ncbi:hypothetical protein V6N12_009242 [Hibiscus sabdariffa]|uniref:Uncharacterized protein n=1 Tax=Hibiscus sabdariffa TaxID=183260 RepID=A0ABR2BIF8_9ROSI